MTKNIREFLKKLHKKNEGAQVLIFTDDDELFDNLYL